MAEEEDWGSFEEPTAAGSPPDCRGLFIDPSVLVGIDVSGQRDCSRLEPSAFPPLLVPAAEVNGGSEARALIHAYLRRLASTNANKTSPTTGIDRTEDDVTTGIDRTEGDVITEIDRTEDDVITGIDRTEGDVTTGIDRTEGDINNGVNGTEDSVGG